MGCVRTDQRITLRAMAELLRRQGYAATGIQPAGPRRPDAPTGSIYHHFKGGKRAIAAAALRRPARPTSRCSRCPRPHADLRRASKPPSPPPPRTWRRPPGTTCARPRRSPPRPSKPSRREDAAEVEAHDPGASRLRPARLTGDRRRLRPVTDLTTRAREAGVDALFPFGRPGRPLTRNHPFVFGFFGALGVFAAYMLVQAVTDAKQVIILIVVALFLAVGLNPAVEASSASG